MEYVPLTAETFIKPTEDYLRVMTDSPEVLIADVPANVHAIQESYEKAREEQAELLVLPELNLTGYSTADLFFNQHVLEQTVKGLDELAAMTAGGPAVAVGAPLVHKGVLYNCAVMLAEGRIAGAVPKSYLPNNNEFYERRWFSSGRGVRCEIMNIGGHEVPFGTDILFDLNGTKVGVEVCEDMWAPEPPSTRAALAGAEIIINLSASNELIGKDAWRKTLVSAQAGRLICGYVYSSVGKGESVADVVYGGHQLMYENGSLVDEVPPLSLHGKRLVYDFDRMEFLHDRLNNKTWADQAQELQAEHPYRSIGISAPRPADDTLHRYVDASPFRARTPEELDERCEYIFRMMATAMARRISDSRSEAMVLGLSGGLDSTLAFLTAVYTCELLGKDNGFLHTITMPGFASSERTQDNATLLAEAFGTTHHVMPIGGLSKDVLAEIGHDQMTEDLTYENTQARIRTLLLMNYANKARGFVVGTGDMSEIAQGWSTYNGDHMSMFNPNVSIPKTLIRFLVKWFMERKAAPEAKPVLQDILNTPVSPELTGSGDLSQTTEDIIGPYDLHDFYLREHQRWGNRPAKIGYLAGIAFKERYDKDEIARWLNSFLIRHTRNQWKRDVMPNGPKIGTISLSPRGDLRQAPNTSPNWFL